MDKDNISRNKKRFLLELSDEYTDISDDDLDALFKKKFKKDQLKIYNVENHGPSIMIETPKITIQIVLDCDGKTCCEQYGVCYSTDLNDLIGAQLKNYKFYGSYDKEYKDHENYDDIYDYCEEYDKIKYNSLHEKSNCTWTVCKSLVRIDYVPEGESKLKSSFFGVYNYHNGQYCHRAHGYVNSATVCTEWI